MVESTRERISPEYAALNTLLHEQRDDYGRSGATYAPIVQTVFDQHGCTSVLDYGCGKGTLAAALPRLNMAEYDPCVPGKDALPEAADMVVCTDVLEHIEPEKIDAVLGHMAALTRKVLWVSIATGPAKKTLPDGRNAHILQRSVQWWLGKMGEHFTFQGAQAHSGTLMGVWGPRPKERV